jgi:hypothetical protein
LWVIDNLEHALDTWNSKLTEIWALLTESPQLFKGGAIWTTVVQINHALQAIGYALLVLFFVVGVAKSTTNFSEIKRPEVALRLFIRFVLAKAVVTYGMELMLGIFDICQGVIRIAAQNIGTATTVSLPQEMIDTINSLNFLESIPLWAVSLIGSLFIVVLSFVMIMTVYARFFKLYLYTAISPIPLATFAGEGTASIGKTFLKSYAGVCLEGAVIVIACIIFSAFASSPPTVDLSLSPARIIWAYMGELVFNLLVLVGSIKMSDRIIKEMMGL